MDEVFIVITVYYILGVRTYLLELLCFTTRNAKVVVGILVGSH